ncbi:MAG: hypothetical protein KIT27_11295 [Legionellales bacterium]|nr:hypothetical protein [Legionellales bacterium]
MYQDNQIIRIQWHELGKAALQGGEQAALMAFQSIPSQDDFFSRLTRNETYTTALNILEKVTGVQKHWDWAAQLNAAVNSVYHARFGKLPATGLVSPAQRLQAFAELSLQTAANDAVRAIIFHQPLGAELLLEQVLMNEQTVTRMRDQRAHIQERLERELQRYQQQGYGHQQAGMVSSIGSHAGKKLQGTPLTVNAKNHAYNKPPAYLLRAKQQPLKEARLKRWQTQQQMQQQQQTAKWMAFEQEIQEILHEPIEIVPSPTDPQPTSAGHVHSGPEHHTVLERLDQGFWNIVDNLANDSAALNIRTLQDLGFNGTAGRTIQHNIWASFGTGNQTDYTHNAYEHFAEDFVGQTLGEGALSLVGKVFSITAPKVLGGVRFFREPLVGVEKYSYIYRQEWMLQKGVGYNLSPESWFNNYSTIGRDGTFITDYRAIGEILGPIRANEKYELGLFSNGNTISYYKVSKLEKSLGLEPGTLKEGFRFTRISRIEEMNPRSPLEGNRFFQGPGVGLPGGGPELVVDSIPTDPWPVWRYK